MNDSTTIGNRQSPNVDQTRNALLEFLSPGTRRTPAAPVGRGQPTTDTATVAATADEPSPGLPWKSLLGSGLSSWWRDHPARAGALLARAATEDSVRRRPLQTLAVAALVGAAVVMFKPWRLVSAGALMLTLLKSSNFKGMATSVLATAAQSLQKEQK